MDNQNQEAPQATSNYQWLRTLGIGFGIVSFGIVIGVIGYILGTKNSQTVVQNQQSSIVPTAVPSPTSIPDETANWKTYSSIKHGFTLKYPSEITLEEKDNVVSFTLWGPTQKSNGHFLDGILLQFSSGSLGNKSLKEFVDMQVEESKELGSEILVDPTTIVIDRAAGYKYTLTGAGTHTKIYLPSKMQGYILIINGTSDPTAKGFQNTVDQILSTFQFSN